MMANDEDRGCFVVDAMRPTNIGRDSVVGGGNKKIDKSANRTNGRTGRRMHEFEQGDLKYSKLLIMAMGQLEFWE